MFNIITLICTFLISFNANSLNYLMGNLDVLSNLDQTEKSFEAQIDKLVETLQKRKTDQEDQISSYKNNLEKIQAEINSLRAKLKNLKGKDLLFANKMLVIYGQIVQVLTEIDQVGQQSLNNINSHIKLLQEQKLDPAFKNKNIYFPDKSIYVIDDLDKVYDLTVNLESNIKKYQDRLKKIYADLEGHKKNIDLLKQEYDENKKEQKELKNTIVDQEDKNSTEFTIKQKGELLDLQAKLISYKIDLVKLRMQESEQRASLLDAQIKIGQLQLGIVNKEYLKIKDSLRVDQRDIDKADLSLKNGLQEYAKKQIDLNKKIEQLNSLKAKELDQIDSEKKRLNISDSDYEHMIDWSYNPKTVSEWDTLITIASLYDQINYEIEPSKDFLLSQLEYEKALVSELEVKNLITNTWYKLIQRKGLDTQDEILKEIKQYEKIKANIQSTLSLISDKKSNASSILNTNAKLSDNIKNKFKEFKRLKNSLFKDHVTEFNRGLIAIKDEFSANSSRRAETITQLIELLNNTSNVLERMQNKIDGVISELNYKSQWGSLPPIWKNLHNFTSDLKGFFNYLLNIKYKQKFEVIKNNIWSGLAHYFTHIYDLLSLLLQIFMYILIYLLLKLFLPDLINFFSLSNIGVGIKKNFGLIVSGLISIILRFIYNNLAPIFIWMLMFIGIYYNFVSENLIGILFYLLSIPFWLYYAHKFLSWFKIKNEEYEYLFVRQEYEKRSFLLFSILLYSTIIIFFFREAFLLSHLAKHDLPVVLLAINYMLFQITLIFMLNKSYVLSLIPKETDFGKTLYNILQNYYYLFFTGCFFIILLSNPYVGYGGQFFWFLSRIVLILLLIPFFIAVHLQIKKLLASVFLSNEEESVKERFPHGRTTFGLLTIAFFILLTCLYLIAAANIWGYSIGFSKIFEFLQSTLYTFEDPKTGQLIFVDFVHIGKAIFYIFLGFIIAYIINKYVLGHIFDLLLINTGIQNAILNLVKYMVIIASIIVSLNSIGLGTSLLYILAIIGGLGVAGKEVITDFIAYFIILVQRPLKIGDYVRLDEDGGEGVVRHITLRSVLLRHKNSTTIIVPNSHIINKPVTNWNYSRTFFAFPDIILTVPYNSDPSLVKRLIFKVLDNNITVLKNPSPIIRLVDFVDNGYQFMVRGFLSPEKVLDQFDIASDVRFEIVRILSENNIKIASPTRLVILDKVINQDNKI